ncbi:MAG: hypothetical protein Q9164_003363, partial [Protoblastenia rupestris]
MPEINAIAEKDSPESGWRDRWAKIRRTVSSINKPAGVALEDKEAFERKIKKRITAEEQKLFVDYSKANTLHILMADSLEKARIQQETHKNDYRATNRAGKKLVLFANNFSGFLQAYSGILEIMKTADSQYKGVAYSTLLLFLIVAVNKQKKEELIEATLLTLQQEYSRM